MYGWHESLNSRVRMAGNWLQPKWMILLGLSLFQVGCAFGPQMLEQTHGRFGAAVQNVEEQEFLKNIVRLRYLESPRDLQVTSIAAQYELTAGAEAQPFFNSQAARFENPSVYGTFAAILPFASVGGSNRPTISLDPRDDADTIRRFLTPISAETLVFLTQTGWPVSTILRIWGARLNGVPNWSIASGPPRNVSTDFERFRRAAELLQSIQDRELASIKYEEETTELSDPLPANAVDGMAAVQAAKDGFAYRRKGDHWILTRRDRQLVIEVHPTGKTDPALTELCTLLNLKPGEDRYTFDLFAGVTDPAKNPSEPKTALQLTPRSTAQALFFLSNGVEIPPEHVACGLVQLPEDGINPTESTRGIFHVKVCPGHPRRPPKFAYTAIWYRDHWYYIDDRDQESKATLLLMLQLRQLDFQRQPIGNVPALTLPIGR